MKKILYIFLIFFILTFSGCANSQENSTSSNSSESMPSSTMLIPNPIQINIEYVGEIINVKQESYVNVRSGPGTENEIIGKAYLGDTFPYIDDGSNEEWKKIQFNDQIGYISQDYIKIKYNIS